MLRANNLAVQRGRRTVLAGIDIQLQAGHVLGVLGPNGAGKSTLLAALCDELPASEGTVSLDGQPLAGWPGQERARRLAVLPQSSSLNFAFTVNEVVGMGRLPHASGRVRDGEIVAEALRAADALHLAERSYLALSGVSASVCTWPACWRNCGPVPRDRFCCSTNRPRCSTRCTSTPSCKPCAISPGAVWPSW